MNNFPGELIPIFLGLGFCALLFGYRYYQNLERMEMIRNGLDPVGKSIPQPYKILKWATLLMGAGFGLFLAYMIDVVVLNRDLSDYSHRRDNVAIYFAMISIFGGLGLFVSFLMEKKAMKGD